MDWGHRARRRASGSLEQLEALLLEADFGVPVRSAWSKTWAVELKRVN